MKLVTITLHKDVIDHDIDCSTYKRIDATLDQASQRSQNAIESDVTEALDARLIARYRDRRDARLRTRLRFCLVPPRAGELSFDNTLSGAPDYVYLLKVPDTFSQNDVQSLGTLMHEYIIRGTLWDWYMNAGIEPLDRLDGEFGIDALEDQIASTMRGRSYGRRPMQPFGPALYDYETDPLNL